MSRSDFSRRHALFALAGLGVSIDFMAARAYAAADGALARKKVIVVICRGGMDGLSVSPPVGDRDYSDLRRNIALPAFGEAGGALALDSTFGLHPALASVHRLAKAGQARIAPAIATPDRARSHFEAQDVLESGGSVVYGTASGWLNRSLEALGPERRVSALSVGTTAPLILRGKVQAASWSPGGQAEKDTRLPGILQDLYANDALLGPALASGLATEAMAQNAMTSAPAPGAAPPPGGDMMDAQMDAQMNAGGEVLRPVLRQGLPQARSLGTTLAGFMTQGGGPQVAAVSIDGFDTHANQGAAQGQLATRLAYLDAFLDGVAKGLGPAWTDTVLMVATEFGRTARVNGTGGTDHGTASTALVMGGALRPGGIIGDWPGLAQASLFENRDTRPTLDMRGLFKGVLLDHMGVDRRALDTEVFPDSTAVAPVTGLV
ncbi:MAG: DUF1501 domain-containing protein [Caulobacteraceae bacterium]